MRIAVVGTGIAGNLVANRLCRDHEVTVFESNDYAGGHSNTVVVPDPRGDLNVDTGFIVFNERTYPGFVSLLDELGVRRRPTDMSFSLTSLRPDLEYCGSSRRSRLFAQRRNLARPWFYRMLWDIVRFSRRARADVGDAADSTIGSFLRRHGFSKQFSRYYLLPMAAAVWSGRPDRIDRMPASFLIRFFDNHGLLDFSDRPTWQVVEGGSHEYVRRLVRPFQDRLRLKAAVRSVHRDEHGVVIRADGCEPERFDRIFLACHSDDALRLLAEPTADECSVLGSLRYQDNEVVLHHDSSVLPRRRLAWAAWNYNMPDVESDHVAVTYNMNILQSLVADRTWCVTLNSTASIDPDKIVYQTNYRHPVFDGAAVRAQRRHGELNGVRNTYYCGAYWRYGFHEDGVVSAERALGDFERRERERSAAPRPASATAVA